MRCSTLVLVAGLAAGCSVVEPESNGFEGCTDDWFAYVEERVSTGDGQGHGPDPGSMEWRSTVEFRLGLRDDETVPPLGTNDWCRFIDDRIN